MNKTPETSKSIINRRKFVDELCTEPQLHSTPIADTKMSTYMDNDDSPIASTQDCNVDVVWDWNSPQAKQRPKRRKKRLIMPQSPKIPLKRHPSNNQIQNLEKLREELLALKDAMSVPDNEESLVLSPLEEEKYKDAPNYRPEDTPPSTRNNHVGANDEDLFNDSADEYLLQCTQAVEADLEAGRKINGCNALSNKQSTSNEDMRVPSAKSFNNEREDSFDNVLKKIDIHHLQDSKTMNRGVIHSQGLQSTRQSTTNLRFSSTKSENQRGKVEFHRTQSFESTIEYSVKKEAIPRHKLDEIERKRKEAVAKLELKRKHENTDSPSKCSPEEIEQKRLQALAKLEAKRQQEIIERKRQEALKRLEISRKKNAVVVKSSLSTRL